VKLKIRQGRKKGEISRVNNKRLGKRANMNERKFREEGTGK